MGDFKSVSVRVFKRFLRNGAKVSAYVKLNSDVGFQVYVQKTDLAKMLKHMSLDDTIECAYDSDSNTVFIDG